MGAASKTGHYFYCHLMPLQGDLDVIIKMLMCIYVYIAYTAVSPNSSN